MTTKADYTEQEWQRLVQAPVLAGTYIILADVSITALGKEAKGMFNAVKTAPVPAPAQELVTSLVADITAEGEAKSPEQSDYAEGEDAKAKLLEDIRAALALLDEKGTPEEREAYATWVMEVARATAEAGREGGFLGIGSTRVSDKEKAALQELWQVLGPG